MTKEDIFDKIHDVYEMWDGGQIPLDRTSEDQIKEIIQRAILYRVRFSLLDKEEIALLKIITKLLLVFSTYPN